MCVCITKSFCHTAEINTTLSINYTAIKSLKIQKKKKNGLTTGFYCTAQGTIIYIL